MRVSATILESWRRFIEPEQDYITEQDILDTIRGTVKPNARMALGSAYGKVIEDPQRYAIFGPHDEDGTACIECYECDAIEFDAAVIDPMLAHFDRRGSFEVKASVPLGYVMLVAKPDHVYGSVISSLKTTLDSFDAQSYMDSAQWRVEALVFQPSRIIYRVALLSEDRDGAIGLRGIESLSVFPYPGMRDDVAALLASFTEFVTARGLDGFLRERQRTQSAAGE